MKKTLDQLITENKMNASDEIDIGGYLFCFSALCAVDGHGQLELKKTDPTCKWHWNIFVPLDFGIEVDISNAPDHESIVHRPLGEIKSIARQLLDRKKEMLKGMTDKLEAAEKITDRAVKNAGSPGSRFSAMRHGAMPPMPTGIDLDKCFDVISRLRAANKGMDDAAAERDRKAKMKLDAENSKKGIVSNNLVEFWKDIFGDVFGKEPAIDESQKPIEPKNSVEKAKGMLAESVKNTYSIFGKLGDLQPAVSLKKAPEEVGANKPAQVSGIDAVIKHLDETIAINERAANHRARQARHPIWDGKGFPPVGSWVKCRGINGRYSVNMTHHGSNKVVVIDGLEPFIFDLSKLYPCDVAEEAVQLDRIIRANMLPSVSSIDLAEVIINAGYRRIN